MGRLIFFFSQAHQKERKKVCPFHFIENTTPVQKYSK